MPEPIPRPTRLRVLVALALSLSSFNLMLLSPEVLATSARIFNANQVVDFIDHSPDGGRVFQLAGPVHFIQPKTNQGCTLISSAADWATDLSYFQGCFLHGHTTLASD